MYVVLLVTVYHGCVFISVMCVLNVCLLLFCKHTVFRRRGFPKTERTNNTYTDSPEPRIAHTARRTGPSPPVPIFRYHEPPTLFPSLSFQICERAPPPPSPSGTGPPVSPCMPIFTPLGGRAGPDRPVADFAHIAPPASPFAHGTVTIPPKSREIKLTFGGAGSGRYGMGEWGGADSLKSPHN